MMMMTMRMSFLLTPVLNWRSLRSSPVVWICEHVRVHKGRIPDKYQGTIHKVPRYFHTRTAVCSRRLSQSDLIHFAETFDKYRVIRVDNHAIWIYRPHMGTRPDRFHDLGSGT